MSRAAFLTPRKASRVKVGLTVLAGVLAALAAGQIAAAPYGATSFANHGVSR